MNSRFTRRDLMRTTAGVGGAAAVVMSGAGGADAAAATTTVGWLNVMELPSPQTSAQGDGTTDDTAAIQYALDNVPATGGVVYLPAGKYLVTSPLSIGNANTWIAGDGWGSQILFDSTVVSPCIAGSSAHCSCAISDLSILQTNTSTTVGTAIDGSNFSNARITNVLPRRRARREPELPGAVQLQRHVGGEHHCGCHGQPGG